ncbi:hypothetical protein GCM10025857_67850 [Alicyclobacillus contaminans]|nr:hypothetical protein GCM10025857_33800 [Alicyclobacillus contaminans]GMA55428.1 hypothetical protein GCM10025857_67850 [Alicyclobacillus contaminans]
MTDFRVGQLVRIGPGADNAVGKMGRVVSVGLCICDVRVEDGWTGAFFKEHLQPVKEG